MPGYARKDIVRQGEVGTYHCWSRCVQRSFLCGDDPVTGRDFNYRRAWIENLLAYQAAVFAVDVGNFNVLSNHVHTMLRTRPDIAATWSSEEVALRWKLAWPEFRDGQWIREPTDEEIEALLERPEKVAKIRENLSSLSWFMARLKEPIAKVCNAEVEASGHFWEARFGSRELLDDAATLTDSLYIDLNQTRAGMADSLENSLHSAIRNRILAAKRREAHAAYAKFTDRPHSDLYAFSEAQAEVLYEDCWLAPICADGPLLTADSLVEGSPPIVLRSLPDGDGGAEGGTPEVRRLESVQNPGADGNLSEKGNATTANDNASDNDTVNDHPDNNGTASDADEQASPAPKKTFIRPKLTRRRASDAPIIDVPWAEYLRVLEAVAGLTAVESTGVDISAVAREQLEDALRGWGMNPSAWLAQFQQLDYRCARALGAARHMMQRAGEVAQRWFQGLGWCREIFVDPPSDEFT